MWLARSHMMAEERRSVWALSAASPERCQPMLSLTAGQPLTPVMGLSPGGGMDKALALRVSGGQGTEFWLQVRETQERTGSYTLEARVSAGKGEGWHPGPGKPR